MEYSNISIVRRNHGHFKLLSVALYLLVFYSLWGFFFTKTIYASNIMVYVSFVSLLILFVVIYLKYGFGKITTLNLVWIPYLMLMMGAYFFSFTLEFLTSWFICFVMIMVASISPFFKVIPTKLIFWSGVFAAIGILVQLFSPSFYYSRIAGIFVGDSIEEWGENYGLAGFTYQLDVTASILIYAEIILLYLRNEVLGKHMQKKLIYSFLVIFLIICVFFTGKRVISIIAIMIPIIVYYASQKMEFKKVLFVALVTIVAIGAYQYFVNNISEFSDSKLLRRFVSTYIDAKMGEDITTGRTYLYEIAWKAFYDNPLTGIGVGQFTSYSGSEMGVHNTYLQVLCEQGIVGFICYILPIIFCFYYTWKLFGKIEADSSYFNYLKISMALQLAYILKGITGIENVGSGYIMYFIAIAILIQVKTYSFAKR